MIKQKHIWSDKIWHSKVIWKKTYQISVLSVRVRLWFRQNHRNRSLLCWTWHPWKWISQKWIPSLLGLSSSKYSHCMQGMSRRRRGRSLAIQWCHYECENLLHILNWRNINTAWNNGLIGKSIHIIMGPKWFSNLETWKSHEKTNNWCKKFWLGREKVVTVEFCANMYKYKH